MKPSVFLWANPSFVTTLLLSKCTPPPFQPEPAADLEIDPAHSVDEGINFTDFQNVIFAATP